MSRTLRITIIAAVAALCAGAALLMMTRGPAILLDLSGAASRVFCF
jgi:hypothetical protein